MPSLTRLVERMRYWCDVADMGYSQYDRWNFNPAGGNCDCSSLVIWSLREAGFDTGGATYTGNMGGELCARGWLRLPVDGAPLPGDILLNDRDHVAVHIGGGLLCQASISETGGVSGAPGDQTGSETNTSRYYDYPWDCYLRYTGPDDQGDTDMPASTDLITYGGQKVTVEYALQDVCHKLEALMQSVQSIGSAKAISDQVWYGQGDGSIEQTPLYGLRAAQYASEAVAGRDGQRLDEIRAVTAQGVREGIESITTTVAVKQ